MGRRVGAGGEGNKARELSSSSYDRVGDSGLDGQGQGYPQDVGWKGRIGEQTGWRTQRRISLLHCPPDGMEVGAGSSLSCAAIPPFQVHKFLDKNHDQVRQDVLELFVRSRTRVSKRYLLLLWPCPRAPSLPSGHSPHL